MYFLCRLLAVDGGLSDIAVHRQEFLECLDLSGDREICMASLSLLNRLLDNKGFQFNEKERKTLIRELTATFTQHPIQEIVALLIKLCRGVSFV